MKIIANKEAIIKLRILKGFSQNELAKKASVSNTVIIRIEQGKNITPASAKKVCNALGIDFEQIFHIMN